MSGLITFVSLFASVITTSQWADFVQYSNGKLVAWGVPLAIIGLVTVIISELWKQVLNAKMIAEAQAVGKGTAELDLY